MKYFRYSRFYSFNFKYLSVAITVKVNKSLFDGCKYEYGIYLEGYIYELKKL